MNTDNVVSMIKDIKEEVDDLNTQLQGASKNTKDATHASVLLTEYENFSQQLTQIAMEKNRNGKTIISILKKIFYD